MLGRKRKKKERNHPCPSVYNLSIWRDKKHTDKITRNIWSLYSLSNVPSQSTEEMKASAGYSSQLQIHGRRGHLKGVLDRVGS